MIEKLLKDTAFALCRLCFVKHKWAEGRATLKLFWMKYNSTCSDTFSCYLCFSGHLLGKEISWDEQCVLSRSGAFSLKGSGDSLIWHGHIQVEKQEIKPLWSGLWQRCTSEPLDASVHCPDFPASSPFPEDNTKTGLVVFIVATCPVVRFTDLFVQFKVFGNRNKWKIIFYCKFPFDSLSQRKLFSFFVFFLFFNSNHIQNIIIATL